MTIKLKITDEEFAELYKNHTIKENVEKLGYSHTWIFNRAKRLGLTSNYKHRNEEINLNIIPGGLPHRKNCTGPCCNVDILRSGAM